MGAVMLGNECGRHAPMTKHARVRVQQRSIPPVVIDALLDFGDRREAGGGAEIVYFTKRTWRKFASYVGAAVKGFERYRSCYVIEASDGSIVTAAFRH
jgi:hypothetical protein